MAEILRAFAQQLFQVVVVLAEKARAELAVGGQANARAVAAKGLRHRGDQADFTGRSVGKAILARGLAFFVRNLLNGPARVNALIDFGRRNHEASIPVAIGIKWHEFDETHHQAAFAGELGEGFDFVVVDTANEHRVHFGGCEP